MNKSMNGKVVLVVGGAGSIGAVSAARFAELGARVAISHRDGAEEAAAQRKSCNLYLERDTPRWSPT